VQVLLPLQLCPQRQPQILVPVLALLLEQQLVDLQELKDPHLTSIHVGVYDDAFYDVCDVFYGDE